MANPYFNAAYYLAQNPDLFAAGINTAEAAWEHYVNFGAAEALNGADTRKPAPWFDVSFYLSQNTDLITAGLTAGQLFDHFTNFGIDEGRKPSVDAVLSAESLLAYAKANEDLMEAFDIEADATELTEDQVKALSHQFYAFGYNEERAEKPFEIVDDGPGAGDTFILTTGTDFADTAGSIRNAGGGDGMPSDFKFTSKNEVVQAAGVAFVGGDTLVDGSTNDNDVLRLNLNDNMASAFAAVRNIEVFDVTATNANAANLDLSNVTGLKTIKLAGAPGNTITVTNLITSTGVSLIDAAGLTTNQTFTTDASASASDIEILGASIGSNVLTGGLGHDHLVGGSNADTLTGGAGNDTLEGGAGADVIDGGTGNDLLIGGAGADTITGGAGNDTLDGGAGDDVLNGGAGNDVVLGGAGADTIDASAGNDTVTGGAGADQITLTANQNNTVIVLEATAADNGTDTIIGFTAGAITAANGGDVIDASAFTGGLSGFKSVALADVGGHNATDANVIVITDGDLAGFNIISGDAAVGGTGDIKLAANANLLVVQSGSANALYVTTDASGTIIDQSAVITLAGVTFTDFQAANFV